VTSRTETAKPRRLNRAAKREANRERILGAARAVFGARGYQGATIEEIAEEAGLSNGAIYYNFGSKGDLFFELLEERQDERIRHLHRTLAETAAGGGRAELEAEARDATHSLRESREWRLLLFEFVAHAARAPSLRSKLRAYKRRFRDAVAEVLEERFAKAGVAAPMPSDQLALAAIALANGLAFEEVSDPGAVPDGLLGELLAMLLAEKS